VRIVASNSDEVANRLANRSLPFESPRVYRADNEDSNEQKDGGDPVAVVNDPLEGRQASD
jgi:hypothetical protein